MMKVRETKKRRGGGSNMDNANAIVARMKAEQQQVMEEAKEAAETAEVQSLDDMVMGGSQSDYYRQALEDGVANQMAANSAGQAVSRGYMDTATISLLIRSHLTPEEKANISPPKPGDFFNSPLRRHMQITTVSPVGKQAIIKHGLIARGLSEQVAKQSSSASWEQQILDDILLSKSVITAGHTRNLSDSITSPITATKTDATVTTRNASPGFLSGIIGGLRKKEMQV